MEAANHGSSLRVGQEGSVEADEGRRMNEADVGKEDGRDEGVEIARGAEDIEGRIGVQVERASKGGRVGIVTAELQYTHLELPR